MPGIYNRRRFVGSNMEQQPKTLFRYIPYLTAPSYTVYTLASPHSDLHKKFPRKAKKSLWVIIYDAAI